MSIKIDFVKDWIWDIDGIIPPFCVEVFMKNGFQFYLHSIGTKNEQTKSLVIRIWDLRAFNEDDIEELKINLNKVIGRKELAEESSIHPKLDWANYHLYIDDIENCIEWHDRLWPEEERPKIGFRSNS